MNKSLNFEKRTWLPIATRTHAHTHTRAHDISSNRNCLVLLYFGFPLLLPSLSVHSLAKKISILDAKQMFHFRFCACLFSTVMRPIRAMRLAIIKIPENIFENEVEEEEEKKHNSDCRDGQHEMRSKNWSNSQNTWFISPKIFYIYSEQLCARVFFGTFFMLSVDFWVELNQVDWLLHVTAHYTRACAYSMIS